VALYTQAWQLAEHGQVRAPCLVTPVPRAVDPDKATLIEEVTAWQHDPNRKHAIADWQFATDGCAHRAEAPIPSNMSDSEHQLDSLKHAVTKLRPLQSGLHGTLTARRESMVRRLIGRQRFVWYNPMTRKRLVVSR
jgi:hypothetical protein